jgi:4,5-dihydroxyphthalate decarboxylase
MFPIIHLVGLKRSLAEKYPWLGRSVYKAFLSAKLIAQRNMLEMGFLHTSYPWLADDVSNLQKKMGPDTWPYGEEKNRKELDTVIRYMKQQGLTKTDVKVSDILIPNSSDTLISI